MQMVKVQVMDDYSTFDSKIMNSLNQNCINMYNKTFYAQNIYFQTFIAPSLLLDINSLWFNLTEPKERIESRWQPAESVAAAARTAFAVNLLVKGCLFLSCLQKKIMTFQYYELYCCEYRKSQKLSFSLFFFFN